MAGRVSGKRRRKGEKGGRGTGAAAGDEDDLAGEGGGANGAVFCHADGLVGRRVSGSFEKRQNGAEGWRGVDTRERVKKSRFRKRVYTTAQVPAACWSSGARFVSSEYSTKNAKVCRKNFVPLLLVSSHGDISIPSAEKGKYIATSPHFGRGAMEVLGESLCIFFWHTAY